MLTKVPFHTLSFLASLYNTTSLPLREIDWGKSQWLPVVNTLFWHFGGLLPFLWLPADAHPFIEIPASACIGSSLCSSRVIPSPWCTMEVLAIGSDILEILPLLLFPALPFPGPHMIGGPFLLFSLPRIVTHSSVVATAWVCIGSISCSSWTKPCLSFTFSIEAATTGGPSLSWTLTRLVFLVSTLSWPPFLLTALEEGPLEQAAVICPRTQQCLQKF